MRSREIKNGARRSSPALRPGGATDNRARVLVIGYGNTLRGDDGIGWRVAEAFARIAPDVEVRAVHQLSPELAEVASHYDAAVFIDAAADGQPGTVRCFEVQQDAPESELTHRMTPAALLGLSRKLYGKAPNGVQITICGESFEISEKLSEGVEAELPRVLQLVGELTSGK